MKIVQANVHSAVQFKKISQPSSGPKKTYKSGTVKTEQKRKRDFERAGSDPKQRKLFEEARTTAK